MLSKVAERDRRSLVSGPAPVHIDIRVITPDQHLSRSDLTSRDRHCANNATWQLTHICLGGKETAYKTKRKKKKKKTTQRHITRTECDEKQQIDQSGT